MHPTSTTPAPHPDPRRPHLLGSSRHPSETSSSRSAGDAPAQKDGGHRGSRDHHRLETKVVDPESSRGTGDAHRSDPKNQFGDPLHSRDAHLLDRPAGLHRDLLHRLPVGSRPSLDLQAFHAGGASSGSEGELELPGSIGNRKAERRAQDHRTTLRNPPSESKRISGLPTFRGVHRRSVVLLDDREERTQIQGSVAGRRLVRTDGRIEVVEAPAGDQIRGGRSADRRHRQQRPAEVPAPNRRAARPWDGGITSTSMHPDSSSGPISESASAARSRTCTRTHPATIRHVQAPRPLEDRRR